MKLKDLLFVSEGILDVYSDDDFMLSFNCTENKQIIEKILSKELINTDVNYVDISRHEIHLDKISIVDD